MRRIPLLANKKKIFPPILLQIGILGFLLNGCGSLAGNPEEDGYEDGSNSKTKTVLNENQTQQVINGNNVTFSPDKRFEDKGLRIFITDAPERAISNLFIKISEVALKQQNGGWLTIPLILSKEIDLLNLQNGLTEELAATDQIELENRIFTDIRLVLDAEHQASAVFQDGSKSNVETPSATESGLKLKGTFEFAPDKVNNLLIDIDVANSLTYGEDKVIFRPRLRVVDPTLTGMVQGRISDNSTPGQKVEMVCLFAAEKAPSDPLNTGGCETAVNSAKVDDGGNYTLAFIPSGKYIIYTKRQNGRISRADEVSVTQGKLARVD